MQYLHLAGAEKWMRGPRLTPLPDNTGCPHDSTWCVVAAQGAQSVAVLHVLRRETWCFSVCLLVGLPEELTSFA